MRYVWGAGGEEQLSNPPPLGSNRNAAQARRWAPSQCPRHRLNETGLARPSYYPRQQCKQVEAVAARVRDALLERSRKAEPGALQRLRMLAASARVKAGIATNPAFFIPMLDVVVDGRELVLTGVTHTPKEHRAIEKAAEALAMGLPVRCELHYRK